MFRKGSQVLPSKWPCPTFKEGPAGCKKRFFSDGQTRRSTHTPGADRRFDDTHDTFACRFYQRISGASPCEASISDPLLTGHLYANFDRVEGGQNVDQSESRRKLRVLRPGAVILPNLDIDDDPGGPRKRFATDELDATFDAKVNDGDDEKEVTQFKVAEAPLVNVRALRIVLQVHEADAKRIRIWKVPKGKTVREGVVVIGPGVGNRFVVQDSITGPPPSGWEEDFFVEALTLAGDVDPHVGPDFLPAPNALAPPPPGSLFTPLPDKNGGSQLSPNVNNSDTSKAIYPDDKRNEESKKSARAVGDIWIELVHETTGLTGPSARDVGLLTIAPWLMLWNTLPCLRTYVVDFSRNPRPTLFQTSVVLENHSTVWDLQLGCFVAGRCSPPDPDTRQPIASADPKNVRSLNDASFYVVDGTKADLDPFVQDQFEVGYTFAPHRTLHVAMNNQRFQNALKFLTGQTANGLAVWALTDLPHSGLGVYNGVAALHKRGTNFVPFNSEPDSVNFGGNLEVSPPIAQPMADDLPEDSSGPAVKKHRKAPFGKIILGDCKDRHCQSEFHRFLLAQKVQPVLPIDTSWLSVGHVDEIMSFIRSARGPGFQVPFASVDAMFTLLGEILTVDPDATLHAGCFKTTPGQPVAKYAEVPIELFLLEHALESSLVQLRRLNPIRQRLRLGLLLSDDDFIPMPMFFNSLPTNPADPDASPSLFAESVGIVNMLVVDNSLMVARPFGPRLPVDQARSVLSDTLRSLFADKAPPVKLPSTSAQTFWVRPGEDLKAIAMYFVRPPLSSPLAGQVRRQLIDRINRLAKNNFPPNDPAFDLSPLGQVVQDAVSNLVRDILQANVGHGVTPAVGGILQNLDLSPSRFGAGHKFHEWMQLTLPVDTVDVVEGFVLSVLEPTGNSVHFISEFESLHSNFGEVHCGTNAIRRNPESDSAFTSRWWDKGVYDPDFDESYTTRK
jgi:hypothetical protein